jgi:hypothetical protein
MRVLFAVALVLCLVDPTAADDKKGMHTHSAMRLHLDDRDYLARTMLALYCMFTCYWQQRITLTYAGILLIITY